MQLPRGQRTKLYVDRKKGAQSFFVALSLTSKTVKLYPIEGNREAYSKLATNPAPTKYGWHETKPYFSWISCAVSDMIEACRLRSPWKKQPS